MVKKVLNILLLIIFIVCSCVKEEKGYNFSYKNKIFIINNGIVIDLNKPVTEIMKNFNNEYEEQQIYYLTRYTIKGYPIVFFENRDKKIISSVVLAFYDIESKNPVKEINEVKVGNIQINNNTSYEEIMSILDANKIEYEIQILTIYYEILIKNNQLASLCYLKKDLSAPFRMEINAE